jgi:DNA-binding IclR family transcriptional regulator
VSTQSSVRRDRPKRKAGVPAVLHTVAILRYLQSIDNRPSTMTEIARELEINASTCFNILKTLASERILSYDEDTRRYTLGTALIEFASLVDSHGRLLAAAQAHVDRLAREINQVCVIFRRTNDDAFLVVGKGEGRRSLRVTATLGDRFPPNGAVLAKSWYAWADEAAVDELIELHGLPSRAPSSITSVLDFKRELERTRARGYALSIGEYYAEHNAVGCPVLSPDGKCMLLLVVTGFASALPAERLDEIGKRLSALSAAITEEVFGTASSPLPSHPRARTA